MPLRVHKIGFVLEIPLQITKDKCNVQNVIVILDMYYYIRLLNPMIRSEFIHHDYLILNQTQNLYFQLQTVTNGVLKPYNYLY